MLGVSFFILLCHVCMVFFSPLHLKRNVAIYVLHVPFAKPCYLRKWFMTSTRRGERGLLIINKATQDLRTAAVSDAPNCEGSLFLLSTS